MNLTPLLTHHPAVRHMRVISVLFGLALVQLIGSNPLRATNAPCEEGYITINQPVVTGNADAKVIGNAESGYFIIYPVKSAGSDTAFNVSIIASLKAAMNEEEQNKVSAMVDATGITMVPATPKGSKGTLTVDLSVASSSAKGVMAITYKGTASTEACCKVSFLPVEVNSLDRYVEGRISLDSLEKIGGIDELSIQVVSKDGSEIHGSFDGLSEAHIYENNDDITSDAEIAEYSGGNLDRKQYDDQSQDMVFWKEDGDLVFATTFDTVGEIKVQFVKDDKLLVEFDYTLTAHAEFSELIDSLDEIFAEIPFPGAPPTILAAKQSSVGSLQVQKLLRRNLVTKCASAVFKKVKEHVVRGVVIATTAAIEAVKTNAVFAQGFVQGLWAGVKDDALAVWEGVQLFGSLLTNPVETCASFRRVFNELLGITWEQFKQVPEKLVDQFITDSQENIAWAGPENDLNLIVYIAGYSTGYITEKVGLALLTGGASAAAQGVAQGANFAAKFVKIIQAVRKVTPDRLLKATAIAADAVKAANATKTRLFRRMSQFAQDRAGITKLRKHLENVIKACPS